MNLLLVHKISVWIFLLIYFIKAFLLFSNKNESLTNFSKRIKVPEMIVSTLFLLTGLYMYYLLGAIKMMQIFKMVAIIVAVPLAVIGFKKANKVLAGLAVFLLLMAYGFAEMARKKDYLGASKIVTTEGVVDGKSVFMAKCVACHGENGAKGYNGASDLSKSILSHQEVVQVIAQGRNNMQPFERSLSQAEIEAVADYIETLK